MTDNEIDADKAQPLSLAGIPALFATIHFRSPERPDGYTPEEIAQLNELANQRPTLKPG
jgi:hypothetical protein